MHKALLVWPTVNLASLGNPLHSIFPGITSYPFFRSVLRISRYKTMLKNYLRLSSSRTLFLSFRPCSLSGSCCGSLHPVSTCVLTEKRAVNASRKLRAENTLVQENNGAQRKETMNTAAPRKIMLMYLYNGPKSSFIMTQDSLEYSMTIISAFNINTSCYYLHFLQRDTRVRVTSLCETLNCSRSSFESAMRFFGDGMY